MVKTMVKTAGAIDENADSEVSGLTQTMNDVEIVSQPKKKLRQSKLTQFFKK